MAEARRPFAVRRLATFAMVVLAVLVAGMVVLRVTGDGSHATERADAATMANGRHLTPEGTQVELGNFPTGGAVSADGRYLWTVSAGFGSNDVRIVDTAEARVCQVIEMPDASGGIALDSTNRLAYVSGLANSRWQPSKAGLPGVAGDDVLVYRRGDGCGEATLDRVIAVPPPVGGPTVALGVR